PRRPARPPRGRAADGAAGAALAADHGRVGEARPRGDRLGRGGAAAVRRAVKDEGLRRSFAGAKPPAVVAAVGPESFLRDAALRDVAEIWLGAADSPDVVTIQP